MQITSAGKFKATCSKLVDAIAQNHEEYIVTKRGVSIVKVIPIDNTEDPFGILKGTVHFQGDIVSEPLGISWKADEETPKP